MNRVVNESIDVIVKYKAATIDIIKFKRGNTEYTVTKAGKPWIERIGNNIITHYNLICGGQNISCEISHDHILNKWLLVQFDILE